MIKLELSVKKREFIQEIFREMNSLTTATFQEWVDVTEILYNLYFVKLICIMIYFLVNILTFAKNSDSKIVKFPLLILKNFFVKLSSFIPFTSISRNFFCIKTVRRITDKIVAVQKLLLYNQKLNLSVKTRFVKWIH